MTRDEIIIAVIVSGLALVGLGLVLYYVIVKIHNIAIAKIGSYILKKENSPYALKKDIGNYLAQPDFVIEHIVPQIILLKHDVLSPQVSASLIPLVCHAIWGRGITGSLKGRVGQVESFFASFSHPETVPYLLEALNCPARVTSNTLLSRQSKGKESYSKSCEGEEYSYGGSFGDEEGYQEIIEYYEVETFELSYAYYYPVAEGAKKSLIHISEMCPFENQRILPAVQEYESRPKDIFNVEQKGEEVLIDRAKGKIVITKRTKCT